MKIRLFGLQRSGTTYIEYLLINNYHCQVLGREESNKHKQSYKVPDDGSYRVHVVRNPLTWAVSFHNFRERFTWYNKKIKYVDLLKIYADIYNKMNTEWLNNCDTTIRYEDDKKKFKRLFLKRKSEHWIDTNKHIHMKPVPTNKIFKGSHPLKHKKEIFLKMLNKELIEELGYDCV